MHTRTYLAFISNNNNCIQVTFCGWCLFSFGFSLNSKRKTEAHNHIKTCPNSQNPGNLYTRGDGESTKAEDFQVTISYAFNYIYSVYMI